MPNHPIAVVTGFAGQVVVGLIALAAIAVFVFGHKPKPCPRHICFPRDEVVTVEQMRWADPARFESAQSEARRVTEFERNRQDGKEPSVASHERDIALHGVADLALVSDKLNPSLSNAPWLPTAASKNSKRSALEQHSRLDMNARLVATI